MLTKVLNFVFSILIIGGIGLHVQAQVSIVLPPHGHHRAVGQDCDVVAVLNQEETLVLLAKVTALRLDL